MKIIEDKTAPKPPEINLNEIFKQIEDGVKQLDGVISIYREHSVNTHLRGCIRMLGYRVREKADQKATILEIAQQTCRAADLVSEISEENFKNLARHASCVLSNVEAEVLESSAMGKQLPESLFPEVPEPPKP